MHRFFKNMVEYVMPVPTSSKFSEKGTITPAEFVQAGDLLVLKCPTWSWEAGDPSKAKDYLPPNKQYLVTRQVPCLHRAKDIGAGEEEEELRGLEGTAQEDGGWVATHMAGLGGDASTVDEIDEIPTCDAGSKSATTSSSTAASSSSAAAKPAAAAAAAAEDEDDDEIPDMEDFEEEHNLVADEATLAPPVVDNILKTRKYDISITYDLYYKTPRIWLFGVDENNQPLSPDAIYEDIYSDYANRTVTIEPHPHLGLQHASIHPCKHSNVMKKMIDRLAEDGKYIRVDLYLFLFLKFISAVIPTINYDFTFEVDAGGASSSSR